MRKKNLKFSILILTVLSLLIITATGTGAAASEIEEITIGYFPNITHAPAIVGVSENIFIDHLNGIKINTRIFPNGSLFMNALATNQIDLGYVGPGPAINRYLQGADVKALASASTGGTVLVTRSDFEYNSVTDLKDKIIATPALGCTHDLLFRQLIKDHNLNTNRRGGSIDHRAQKPATMVGLFATKQLDAAVVSEPWAARMESDLNSKVVVDWDQMPWNGKLPAALVVSSSEFINNNPELIDNFLQAHQKTVEYINNNPVQSSKIIQQQIKEITRQELSIEIIERSMQRTNITSALDSSVVQKLADLSAELGFIKGDPNLNGFIDSTYLNKITR
ncbi:aliphatic sulfonate ABC transporter substrate-binding protein [Halanaerobium sp.]|uniref:aliphatic sulfonate ABC transporter substrate-binding protein n=1 Tax=Halanaerobium sp. TaxID=1895664 RepID=UPI000DE5D01B|nr:aliphatic sulfonate ABC transporter substrate-binding protein [Halanaerobium sp.]PUU88447.1 MAG: aliphatic sulfonates family ABC transporter substrate-binding protein [Halanaerobium sp.]PUU90602.1 MAG: aliphatic sulfonates family ABC transporter substrate-binding protein [Halanaerobium sp.]